MVQIIMIIAGIFILAKGTVKFTTEKTLSRPESIFIGIAIIVNALIVSTFPDVVPWSFVSWVIFFIIIIIAYFLSKKENNIHTPPQV